MRKFWTTAAVTALCALSAPAWSAPQTQYLQLVASKEKLRGTQRAEHRRERAHDRAESRKSKSRSKSRASRAEEASGSEKAERGSRGRRSRHKAPPSAIKTEAAPTVKVGRGDTLTSISRDTGVPVEQLAKLNGLKKPYHLRGGATLKLPSRRYYTVKSGDTLYSIAKRFGVDASDVAEANDSKVSKTIHGGQKLYLPQTAEDREAPAPEPEAPPEKPKPAREKPRPTPVPVRPAPQPAPSYTAPSAPQRPPAYPSQTTPAPTPAPERDILDEPDLATPVRPRPYSPPPSATTPPPASAYPAPTAQPPFGSPPASVPATPRPASPPPTQAQPPVRTLPPPQGAPMTTQPAPAQGGVFGQPRPTTPIPAPSAGSEGQGFELAPGRPYQAPARPYPPQPAPTGRPQIIQTSPPPNASDVATAGRGRFVWPVNGTLISGFGSKGDGQRNDGLNISAVAGDSVRASADGEVVYAGDQVPSFGNLVLVKHQGGWVTAYAHMSRIAVKNRDQVVQGQELGIVGQTGTVDRPQLHFEIRYAASPKDKATPIDPMLLLPGRQ